MVRTQNPLFRFLGWNTQGDLGPWTMYTSRRAGLVVFIKAPPKEPPAPLQTYYRNKLRAIGLNWSLLDQATRDKWEQATRRANLRITGYNLWMYYSMRKDRATITTIERQTGINLIT